MPTLIGFLSILYKFFTKGVEGVDSLSKPSTKLESLWSKPKFLYAFVISYSALVTGSIFWIVYEFTADLDGFMPWIIIMAIASFIYIFVITFWGFRRAQKIRERIPPPGPGASAKEMLDWDNLYHDEAVYKLGPLFTKILLIWLASMALISIVVIIVAFVSH